jgi:hypothetical protein
MNPPLGDSVPILSFKAILLFLRWLSWGGQARQRAPTPSPAPVGGAATGDTRGVRSHSADLPVHSLAVHCSHSQEIHCSQPRCSCKGRRPARPARAPTRSVTTRALLCSPSCARSSPFRSPQPPASAPDDPHPAHSRNLLANEWAARHGRPQRRANSVSLPGRDPLSATTNSKQALTPPPPSFLPPSHTHASPIQAPRRALVVRRAAQTDVATKQDEYLEVGDRRKVRR